MQTAEEVDRWTADISTYNLYHGKRRGWIQCIMHECACACVYQRGTAIYDPDEMPRGRIKCIHVDYHNEMHNRIWILSVICLSALWDPLKLPLSVCVRAWVRARVCVERGGCTCSLIIPACYSPPQIKRNNKIRPKLNKTKRNRNNKRSGTILVHRAGYRRRDDCWFFTASRCYFDSVKISNYYCFPPFR